ncbi:MAG: hypothetical protein IT569_01990 [Leptospiraceae bacterium]|nr:hypothetical protein [Leptospiraceae bacterium]
MGDSDNVYSIRFIAKDESSGYFCIFCGIFDSLNGKFDLYETLVSSQVTFSKVSPQATYKDYSNAIQSTKYKGEFSQNYTSSLTEGYRFTFLSENFIEELRHYLEHKDNERLTYLFQQPLIQILGSGAKLEINLLYDLISRQDIEKASQAENSTENPSDLAGSIIPQGSMVVNFKFALSPVSGIKVSDLKEGSRVMVKVVPGDTNSNNAINLLKLKDEGGNVKIIPASIVFINHTSKGAETVIKVTDSIFGKYIEEEPSIKVKLAGNETLASVTSPQIETRRPVVNHPKPESNESSSLPITLLVALGLLGIVGAFIVIFML